MHISDLFWLFFVFSALQPVLRQQMIDAMRTRKIAQLERKRNSRVILLVHRQETMRFLGFPLARYIDINDWENVLRAIQMTDYDVPLDMVLHTPGGLVLAALQIGASRSRPQIQGHSLRAALRDVGRHPHCAGGGRDRHVQALRSRPYRSATGGFACRLATQGRRTEAGGGNRRSDPDPRGHREEGNRAGQASGSGPVAANDPGRPGGSGGGKPATGTWTHDYPIWATTAKELGLPVRTDMPNEVLELMSLYPQPVRRQNGGGVEYLPTPRQKEA